MIGTGRLARVGGLLPEGARIDPLSYRLWTAVALTLGVLLGFALAGHPFMSAGAVGGALVLMVLLIRPVVLLGGLLAVGMVNLAFLTGGEKELLSGMGGIDMNGIRLVGVVAGFAGLLLIDRRMLHHALGRHGRIYLLFLVFAAGTLIMSPAQVDGARLLFKLAYPFLMFVAISAMVRDERDLDRLGTWTLVAACVLTMVINPVLVIAGGYQFDASGHLRVQGLGMHQNPFSYYLIAMALLSLARYIFRGQRRYLLLAFGLTGWIVVTFSRMPLLAGLAALSTMALYGAFLRRNPKPVLAAVVIAAALAVPLTPVVLDRTLGFVPAPAELVTLLSDPASLVQMMHWGGRDRIWPVLASAFTENPVIGGGLGASAAVLQSSFSSWSLDVPHNEYLRLLVDTGLVGTLLFFLAILGWWIGAARAGRARSKVGREYALAAVAAVVAWALISLTGNPLDYYTQFTQYVGLFVAGAITAARLESESGQDERVLEPSSEPGRAVA